jgi:hypothetical protein
LCITILTNHFWCEFLVYIWTTLFRVYYFSSKQEACQEVLCEQEVTIIMPWCHPSYLKTVSQQMVCRTRTHSLRFLTANTAFLVGIIQIHTNFGCLKWLHTKNFCIWEIWSAIWDVTNCILPIGDVHKLRNFQRGGGQRFVKNLFKNIAALRCREERAGGVWKVQNSRYVICERPLKIQDYAIS